MRYGYGDHMDSGWGAGGWIMMILFLLIVVGIAVVVVWTIRTGPIRTTVEAPSKAPGAEDVLANRLAHGEISPEEYRERLEALRGGGAGGSAPNQS